MANCVICAEPASKGSSYCSRCQKHTRRQIRDPGGKPGYPAYNGRTGDAAGSPVGRRRPVSKGGIIVWAGLISGLKLDFGDREFTAVVRRLAGG